MLKGKKALYILLSLVAFIWGAIIFQIIGAFSDENPVVSDAKEISVSPLKTKERDTFSLGEIKRDPFLGTLYIPKKKENKLPLKPKTKKEPMIWPPIQYKGVVSGQNSANAIYLIQINNIDQLIKLKETISEVTLLKAFSNSIQVRYKGKVKEYKIIN